MRRPDAVGLAPAGRPGEHRRQERDAERLAQCLELRARVLQHVAGEHDGRRAAQPLGHAVEDLALLGQAGIREARVRVGLEERGHHLVRLADQERVGESVEPVATDHRQQVVRHVLLVPERPAARDRAGQGRGDASPVGIVRREDFRAAGMGDARDLQVVRIERLVADEGVGPAAERAQHGGRDVARAGPHGDPLRHSGPLAASAPVSRRPTG